MSVFENLEFKYHGNYGGPNYTGGKKNGGYDVEPVDDLDELFRKHDYDYEKINHDEADALFLRRAESIPWSLKKQGAQLAFGAKNFGHKRHVKEPNYKYPWESPAVTSRGDFKIAEQVKMSGRGGKKKGIGARKARKRAMMTRAKSKAIVRKNKKVFRAHRGRKNTPARRTMGGIRRGGRGKLYTAPLAQGRAYAGNGTIRMGASAMKNCNRVRTRIYLGSLGMATGSGATYWFNNAATPVDNKGNWFFCPTNSFYMNLNQFNTLSRMYQTYSLENVSFDFESLLTPGQTNGYRVVYGFVEEPNMLETFIPSYSPSTVNTKNQVLSLTPSKSVPAWVADFTIAPPKKFYYNKLLQLRGTDLTTGITTSSLSYVAVNRQNYAFGMLLVVDGPTPGANTLVSDIFMNVDINLCDLTAPQVYDIVGGSTFSNSSTSSESKMSDMMDRLSILEKELKQELPDIEEAKLPTKLLEDEPDVVYGATGKPITTVRDMRLTRRIVYDDDEKVWSRPESVNSKKSTSNKSGKTVDLS